MRARIRLLDVCRVIALLASQAIADDGVDARSIVRAIVAHRGSSADRPENTMASTRRAIEAGATAVEVDVRWSKDKQLVLMHDATLDRTTTGTGPVSEQTYEDIAKLDAGSWFDARFRDERVPTLRMVLTECRQRIDVLLDLKEQGEEYARAVVNEVQHYGDPRRTIVGVRSVEQAKQFRNLLPQARQLGLIASPDDIEDFIAAGAETIRLWPKWLSQPLLVDRVRRAGAKLHLNPEGGSPEEVIPLLRHRPDSMSSDDPARLVTTLRKAPREAFGSAKR